MWDMQASHWIHHSAEHHRSAGAAWRLGGFDSQPPQHPLAAKRRLLSQPTDPKTTPRYIKHPQCAFCTSNRNKESLWLLFTASPILILSYLFNLPLFLLIACFLVKWRLAALPGCIQGQKKRQLNVFSYIHMSAPLALFCYCVWKSGYNLVDLPCSKRAAAACYWKQINPFSGCFQRGPARRSRGYKHVWFSKQNFAI